MTDFRYPEYTLDSFGQVSPPRPSNRPTWLYLLLGCGGATACILLICVGCFVMSTLALRNPTFMVTGWLTYMSQGNYTFAETLTCPSSPARNLTRTLTDQNATFPVVNPPQADGDTVTVETPILIAGEESVWKATFTVTNGGTLGRCIQTIEVEDEI